MVVRPSPLSTRVPVVPTFSHPFDHEAAGYLQRWDARDLVRFLRARVIAAVVRAMPPPSRVLDIGCGPGTDALLLGALGYAVRARDPAPAMVAAARGRGVSATVGGAEGLGDERDASADVLLSDFGAPSCITELRGFAGEACRVVRPGGAVVLVPVGPRCLADDLAHLASRRRPRRRSGLARVGGAEVRVRAWSAAEIRRAFAGRACVERVEALGALLPPPDMGGAAGWRARMDGWLGGWPIVRGMGDHTLLVLRRNDR